MVDVGKEKHFKQFFLEVKMFKIFGGSLGAMIAFLVAGFSILGFDVWVFWASALSGVALFGLTWSEIVELQKNTLNLILRELDPQKGYIVRERMKCGVISLIDLTEMKHRIAEIEGSYPPVGFTEVKTDGRTFLIPDSKKLAIGHKSEFVFAHKLSET